MRSSFRGVYIYTCLYIYIYIYYIYTGVNGYEVFVPGGNGSLGLILLITAVVIGQKLVSMLG
jgi:hypothetical protein